MRRLTTVTLLVVAAAAAATPSSAADDGKTLYETKCALCHGKSGVAKPAGKGSRNFDDPAFQASSTIDAIVEVVSKGKAKMPAYRSTLTPAQIQAVAAHIKTLGSPK
jgi:mono/diheme cytochrome c family protein